MPCTAQLRGVHRDGCVTEDWLTHENILYEWPGLRAPDLRTECQHIPAIAQHDGAVYCRQPPDGVRCVLERAVAAAVANQVAELRERWRDLVGNGDDRFAPRLRAVRHHQERPAVTWPAHRQGHRQYHM